MPKNRYQAAESAGGEWFVYEGEVAVSHACSKSEAQSLAREMNAEARP